MAIEGKRHVLNVVLGTAVVSVLLLLVYGVMWFFYIALEALSLSGGEAVLAFIGVFFGILTLWIVGEVSRDTINDWKTTLKMDRELREMKKDREHRENE